jgi:hypothetical protein
MAVLGLLLMVAAGVLTAGVLLSNTNQISAEAFGVTLSNVSVGGIFAAGAVTALVFALGLWMLLQGMRRARRRRLERREIVRDTRDQTASLAAEKDRLEKELEAERGRRANTAPMVNERAVVEREPVVEDTAAGPTDGSERASDRPRPFRR